MDVDGSRFPWGTVAYLSTVQLGQTGRIGYNVANFAVTVAVAVPVTVAVAAAVLVANVIFLSLSLSTVRNFDHNLS